MDVESPQNRPGQYTTLDGSEKFPRKYRGIDLRGKITEKGIFEPRIGRIVGRLSEWSISASTREPAGSLGIRLDAPDLRTKNTTDSTGIRYRRDSAC